MPIFISYSHSDKDFVDTFAAHLVKANANVWVDRWELNVGDSLIARVQDAIEGSDALLVILSKSSVESEWCKKELSTGLIRELDEKRVVVLPVVIDDCKVPLFLRDKMYADMRNNFDSGLKSVLDAIAKVTNIDQGRLYDEDNHTDWAVDWGYDKELFELKFTIVNVPESIPMTFLTEVNVLCNEVATKRYRQYQDEGIGWLGRVWISEVMFDLGNHEDIRIILENQTPQKFEGGIQDQKIGLKFDVTVTCRKLGEDNGKDQLINVSYYLKRIRDYIRHASRNPTPKEKERLLEIVKTPIGA